MFLGATKFWGAQKKLGGHCSQMPPWLWACITQKWIFLLVEYAILREIITAKHLSSFFDKSFQTRFKDMYHPLSPA